MITASRRPRLRLLGAIAAFALLAGACGGDDDDTAADSGAATVTADDTADSATAAATSDEGGSTADTGAADPGADTSSGDSAADSGDDGSAEVTADTGDMPDVDRDADLTFAISFGAQSLDPHRYTNPGWVIWMRPLYDRLLTLVRDDDGSVSVGPQLATSYEFSDDGLDLTMELRDDVTFWDGTPFDADVVVANFERETDEESTVASFLTQVESVEAVDATHVVYHLSQPYPALPYSLAADAIGMMVNPNAFDTDLSTQPAGSGPFQLASFTPDADVVYERWDDHWDPDAALVKTLTITTVSDSNARFNGVRTGEYDAAYMSQPLDLQSRDLDGDGFQWEQELGAITQGVLFNMASAPFDDVKARQAVSMAIDRDAIATELLGGLAPPVFQPFASPYLGYDPALDVDPYDPDGARALFEEIGLAGESLELLAIATPPYDSIAQVVQQSLADVGVDVEIVPISPTEAIPTWREGSYPFYIGTILAEPEPSLTIARSYLGSSPGEPPADLVEMADAALTLPIGSAEREEAYQAIGALIQDQVIFATPIVQFSTVIFASDQVVNADDISKVVIGKADFRGVGIAAS